MRQCARVEAAGWRGRGHEIKHSVRRESAERRSREAPVSGPGVREFDLIRDTDSVSDYSNTATAVHLHATAVAMRCGHDGAKNCAFPFVEFETSLHVFLFYIYSNLQFYTLQRRAIR